MDQLVVPHVALAREQHGEAPVAPPGPLGRQRAQALAKGRVRHCQSTWLNSRGAGQAAAAPALRPEDLVFVDESGAATNKARLYDRAEGGRRARGTVPAGRWERLTLVGGLSLAGLLACMTVHAAADTDVLVAFTRHVLVPALRPGPVVVLTT